MGSMSQVAVIALLATFFMMTRGNGLCPVSAVMDPFKTHNGTTFRYPLDVYAPQDVRDRAPIVECVTHQGEAHECPTRDEDAMCPVHLANIEIATSRLYHPSLCHLKRKLNDKNEAINIYIFGGSVVYGSEACGCMSSDPITEYCIHCTWPRPFSEWMNATFAANITLRNLAAGGETALMFVRTLPWTMDREQIPPFNSNDVIFLDHAVNENHLNLRQIERSLENVFVRIYSLSQNGSWPTLFLMDSDPRNYSTGRPTIYHHAYEKVARHYNVPILSFRDLIWSDYAIKHQNSYTNETKSRFSSHVPWHVHLWMADLYGAIFERQLSSQCPEALVQQQAADHARPVVLPEPLTLLHTEIDCNYNLRPYLSVRYSDIVANLSSVVGSYSLLSETHWHLKEDKKGRGGFIFELPESVTSVDDRDRLTLTFGTPTKEILTRLDELQVDHVVLQILYLRTYENAGAAKIFLCGQEIETMDALWEDWSSNRVSIPELLVLGLQFRRREEEEDTLLLTCDPAVYEYPVLEIVPLGGFDPEDATRGRQKFKVMNVKVCPRSDRRRQRR